MIHFQIILVALAAAVATALPQTAPPSDGAPASMPEIPQCVIDCIIPAVKETGCKIGDGPECLCKNETFTSSVLACVTAGCEDPSIVATFTEMSGKGCEQYGGGVPTGY
ncbi:hypothetical protein BZA05DRAFT_448697 [Tricharina praecox]|uniref:uncharacterized protein n=1 Tax=Tricharina praecox TaxID=43433 RepID=UPI00221F8D8C|nr:uncharacterized protein BZA05DRAFT_448697 [Tricharina praecox]KAI5843574.1 hypothetical protein BZA05DRAFT_448697 [Tricharina praecox]